MSDTYKSKSYIEEVEILDELEEVEKTYKRYSFPVVHIGSTQKFYFNEAALPYLKAPTYRIGTTPEYIVFIPAKKGAANSFCLVKSRKAKGRFMSIPKALWETKMKLGAFRLMKYKDGLCYKRYEPLGKEDDMDA